ncbi:MAG: alpha/beta fold hydrolase [Candidatus Moranbacteria bacterium]|nr:alpha/beta fold hydrolase [Candidatus Moranbacteria bacterium]
MQTSWGQGWLALWSMVPRLFRSPFIFVASKKKVDAMNEESLRTCQRKNIPLTVLLHGFLGDYLAPYWALRQLKQGGVPVASLGYDYRTDVATMAEQVKTQIDAIRARTGIEKINLVGISLGGSVARYYVEKLGGKDIVHKLVTIFTPVLTRTSSRFDRAFLLHSLVNRPAAELSLEQLDTIKDCFSAKQHLALYGTKDWIVDRKAYPLQNVPASVSHIVVSGGHLLVSYDADVFKLTLEYLRDKVNFNKTS